MGREFHFLGGKVARILVTQTIVDGRVSAVAGDILNVEGRDRAFVLSNNLGVLMDEEPVVSGLLPHEEREVAAPKPEAPKVQESLSEPKESVVTAPKVQESLSEPKESVVTAPETKLSEGGSAELERPKPYASKPEWVAYAISRGADEDRANSMGKAELVKLYGNDA
jgi:hypothetical protein